VAAIVLAPLVLAAAYVYQKHQDAQRMLDELQPRYARLLGLQQHAPALADAAEQAQAALSQRLYGPDADPGATANEALQRARSLLEEAGLGIEASQTSPAQDDGPLLQRIPLAFTAEGDLAAILAGLQKLHTASPAIRVVKLTLRPAGLAPPSSNPKLKLQLNLAVWRPKAS
jgi:general secretion pathway protein M